MYFNEEKFIRIIVTAGPTIEPIDPVRFISNRSTGVMGYKIAEEALARGHRVTLISGPVKIAPPKAQKFIQIETAEELLAALKKEIKSSDCLIMSAAVSDFRPRKISAKKIKRNNKLSMVLLPNKDILRELTGLKKRNLFIGFSLETENMVNNSYHKLKNKNLDFIVANSVTKQHNPFGNNKLDVNIIGRNKEILKIRKKSKAFIAHVLLDKVEKLWYLRNNN
ncbi:MAG: phosphopantothenoylcysteine decarboxylase [Candidatus Omnitrophota bacterium]|jgi:phosphopantothenoylcysteine decarboxylase/phosphopantothenate--cysteine ligase